MWGAGAGRGAPAAGELQAGEVAPRVLLLEVRDEALGDVLTRIGDFFGYATRLTPGGPPPRVSLRLEAATLDGALAQALRGASCGLVVDDDRRTVSVQLFPRGGEGGGRAGTTVPRVAGGEPSGEPVPGRFDPRALSPVLSAGERTRGTTPEDLEALRKAPSASDPSLMEAVPPGDSDGLGPAPNPADLAVLRWAGPEAAPETLEAVPPEHRWSTAPTLAEIRATAAGVAREDPGALEVAPDEVPRGRGPVLGEMARPGALAEPDPRRLEAVPAEEGGGALATPESLDADRASAGHLSPRQLPVAPE